MPEEEKQNEPDIGPVKRMADEYAHLNSKLQKVINSKYQVLIDGLDDTSYKFNLLLLSSIRGLSNEGVRSIYINGFLTSIINNHLALKFLFIGGLHLQLQPLMRTQFEQMNVLTSSLYDEEFLDRFGVSKDGEFPITPKQVHTERIVKRVFSELSYGSKIWPFVRELMTDLYSELSQVTHGNLFKVSVQSMVEDEDENLIFVPGGTDKPLWPSLRLLMQMNNYSQIIWRALGNWFIDEKLIDSKDINDIEPFLMHGGNSKIELIDFGPNKN